MKCCSALLLLLALSSGLVPSGWAQHRLSPSAAGQVMDGAALDAAGVTRLGDLFTLLDGWPSYSLDGFTTVATTNGLAPFQQPNLRTVVDGIPVNAALFGTLNLNALPFHPLHVDTLLAFQHPVFSAGRIAPAGALHFRTRRPAVGLSVRGSVAAGNDTQDPGPYRYTPFATPNIDRLGPTLQAEASIAGRNAYLAAGIKTDEHHVTDALMIQRVYDLYEGERKPRVLQTAPHLRAGIRNRLGEHRLFAGFSRLDDLRYFEPAGQEIPTRYDFTTLGLSGDFNPDARHGLTYHLSLAQADLDTRPNQRALDFNWRQDRLESDLAFRTQRGRLYTRIGAGLDYRRSLTDPALRHASLLLPRLSLLLFRQGRAAKLQGVVVGTYHRPFDTNPARVGVSAQGSAQLRLSEAHHLRASLAYLWQGAEEQNSLWYWMGQGYRLPQGDVSLPPFFLGSRTYTADLSYTVRPSPRVALTLNGFARQFFGATLATASYDFNALTDGFLPQTRVLIGRSGRVLGGAARLHLALVPGFSQQLSYTFTRPVAGQDLAFWEAWASYPVHQAGATFLFAPNTRFSLQARLRYQSPTFWPGYAPADAQTGGRFPTRRPPYLLLDVTAQKRFWGEHLRANLSLRNAANTPLRSHPAGDLSHLTLYFQLEAFFNYHN